MSYSITYGQPQNSGEGRIFPRNIALVVVCLSIVGMLCIPKVRVAVRDFLLPGDGATTAKAIADFANSVDDGVPLREAVEAFCVQIIYFV